MRRPTKRACWQNCRPPANTWQHRTTFLDNKCGKISRQEHDWKDCQTRARSCLDKSITQSAACRTKNISHAAESQWTTSIISSRSGNVITRLSRRMITESGREKSLRKALSQQARVSCAEEAVKDSRPKVKRKRGEKELKGGERGWKGSEL